MADIVVIGGGVGGLSAALMLAADGHEVTVLERDPAPPPANGDEAWDTWERKGVNQFRMIHYFLPRFRQIAEAELPDVIKALDADGALRLNAITGAPDEITGGARPDDDRFDAITGRRPMVESAFARVAAATPGITVRRGAAVKGLLTGDGPGAIDGVPHVVGVVTDDGQELRGDLVVDATGRRSALPKLLTDIGARAPIEELDDCGFMYYGRYYRSPDGSLPVSLGPPLQPYDSISILNLPADNGTWGLGVIASASDAELRAAKDTATWEAIVGAYPLLAHWLDGEPMTDIQLMAKIEDRHRSFVVDGVPVATGVAPVGDSWACTNPSVGRGASIALMHVQALRDLIRDQGLDDAGSFALAWHATTAETVEPFYRDTLDLDRHRLAEIEAQIAGVPYETDDPAFAIGQAMAATMMMDPEIFRGFIDIASLLDRPDGVLARPGVLDRVIELSQAAPIEPLPGPSRGELLDLIHTI